MNTWILGWLIGSIIVATIGIKQKGGFFRALFLSLLLTPIVGLFLTIGGAKKNPIGCNHCGNEYNEAEFCGMCGKNAKGLTKEGE